MSFQKVELTFSLFHFMIDKKARAERDGGCLVGLPAGIAGHGGDLGPGSYCLCGILPRPDDDGGGHGYHLHGPIGIEHPAHALGLGNREIPLKTFSAPSPSQHL